MIVYQVAAKAVYELLYSVYLPLQNVLREMWNILEY